MVTDSLENRMEKLEGKVDHIYRDLAEVKADLKELVASLSGNSIQDGFVSEIRKDINDIETDIKAIEKNTLRKDQIEALDQIIHFFKGWKFTFGVVVFLVQLAISIIITFREVSP